MALSAEQQAQLKAIFGKKRGRFTLTALQQAKMYEFCAASERAAAELPLEVGNDSEHIAEEWDDLAKDAGLTTRSDVNGLVRWATASPLAPGSQPDARAASVLDLLLERGVTVPAGVQAEVTATLREVGDAGDVLAQST